MARNPVNAEKSAMQELEAKLTKIQKLARKDQGVLEELQRKLEEERKTNSKLQTELSTVERNYENLSQLTKEDRDKLRAAERRANELEATVSHLHGVESEAHTLRQTVDVLRKRNDNLAKVHELAEASLEEERKRRIESETQLKSISSTALSWDKERPKLMEKIQELEKQVNQFQHSAAKVSSEHTENKRQLELLAGKNSSLSKELTAVQSRAKESETELQQSRSENETLQREMDGLRKTVALLKQAEEKLKKQQQEFKELKAKFEQFSMSSDKQQADHISASTQLKQQYSELQESYTEMKSKYDMTMSMTHQMETALDEKRTENEALKLQVQKLTAELRPLQQFRQQHGGVAQELQDKLAVSEVETSRVSQLLKEAMARLEQVGAQKETAETKLEKSEEELNSWREKTRSSELLVTELRRRLMELSVDDRLETLRTKEAQLRHAIQRIIAAEEATEAALSCCHCLKIMPSCVTCVPCGHNFCESCLESLQSTNAQTCPECEERIRVSYHNETLDNLCSKHSFKKQALYKLKDDVAQVSSPMRETFDSDR